MYKAIIYSNNLEIIKKTCNCLFSKSNNIKLIGIFDNIKEFNKALSSYKINMVVLSEMDFKNSQIQYLLKDIENKIVFCTQNANIRNSKYMLNLPLQSDNSYIYEQFQKFILKLCNRTTRKKVYKVLEKLNFDFKLNGTNYLLEAIVYSYMNKDKYLFENLKQEIYPYVAKIYNVKPDNVKWAIIRSINSVKINSNFKNFCSQFCDKITTKTLISEIVNRI